MKTLHVLLLLPLFTSGQDFYGFRHLQMTYKGDTVNILVKSRAREEHRPKPLLFFCQGSLPVPLLLTYTQNGQPGAYGTFPFNPDSLTKEYHLVIAGKPGVPVVYADSLLHAEHTFEEQDGRFPRAYVERNLLSYYVARDIAVIRFLQRQPWVMPHGLVVAGHSEGSTIALKLAVKLPEVTRLIYSGGNPAGRMATIIARSRARETDSNHLADEQFLLVKTLPEKQ